MQVILNNKIIRQEDARINPLCEGLQYGKGMFETAKIKNGKIPLLQKHWERLLNSCEKINLTIPTTLDKIESTLDSLIKQNNTSQGACKIVAFQDLENTNILITTEKRVYSPEAYKKGFALKTQVAPASNLDTLKSCNYLEKRVILEAAKKDNFNEVILLDEKEQLREGTFTNIFFIKNKQAYTPSKDCKILPGIARSEVISILKEQNIPFQTGFFTLEELLNADEVFVTNALLEIMPVSSVNGKAFDLKYNSLTLNLMAALESKSP